MIYCVPSASSCLTSISIITLPREKHELYSVIRDLYNQSNAVQVNYCKYFSFFIQNNGRLMIMHVLTNVLKVAVWWLRCSGRWTKTWTSAQAPATFLCILFTCLNNKLYNIFYVHLGCTHLPKSFLCVLLTQYVLCKDNRGHKKFKRE